ncbi:MAG: hypothetical protein WHS82_02715 [Candidatus Methanosuratincola sp.]
MTQIRVGAEREDNRDYGCGYGYCYYYARQKMINMPFTPFHLGPGILLGLLLLRYLDLPTLLVASVVLDLEPLLVIITGADYPLHGFFHTLLGGGAAAVAAALVMWRIRGFTGRVANAFGIRQEPSFGMVAAASFLGVYTHLLLDAPLYTDIKPFFPSEINPLFFPEASELIYASCIVAFILGLAAYASMLFHKKYSSGPVD